MTVRTQAEDLSLLDGQVLKTVVMTGSSLLEKNRNGKVYDTCKGLFYLDKHASPPKIFHVLFEETLGHHKSYLHLALQNQTESCHQMCPDLKNRKNTLIHM